MYKKKKYLGLLILGIIVICIVMCVINRKLVVEAISEAIPLVGGLIIGIISMLILVHSIFGSEESHSRNRDDIENYYNDLVGRISIPVVSGGDGTGNHPSQSLLDLMTIREEFGHFEGLKIVIVGDIVHSRVAHSNYEIMKRLGMEVYTSGPKQFEEPGYNYVDFDKILPEVDIVMLLRVQHERHHELMRLTTEQYHDMFGLNQKRVDKMKKGAIIMHPAPFNRNVEIADDIVECSKSRIFKQMTNGVYVRMALLNRVLSND